MPPRSPVTSWLRHLRAGSLTTVIVGLAVAAHSLGGGGTPSALVVGVSATVVMLCCTVATGRRLSAVAITVILASAQLVLHHVFSVAVSATPNGHRAGMPMTGAIGSHLQPGWTSAPVTVPADSSGGWSMLLSHGVATAICALALTLGERALWALWTALVPVLPPSDRPVTPTPPRPAPIVWLLAPRPRLVRWRRTQRRGPPRPCVVVSPA